MFQLGKGLERRFLGRKAPSGAFLASGWSYFQPSLPVAPCSRLA